MEIGDRVPSRLDSAYFDYKTWCQRLRITPASYDSWLRIDRLGAGHTLSRASGGMCGLTSYAESRRRVAALPAMEWP
jgi:hypothetical protein